MNRRHGLQAALLAPVAMMACGCQPNLPDAISVLIGQAQSVNATLGSGPEQLANSTWALKINTNPDGSGQDIAIANFVMGTKGEVVQVSILVDDQITQQLGPWIGLLPGYLTNFVVDGNLQSAPFLPPGVAGFKGGSYGAEDGDDVGFTVVFLYVAGPTQVARLDISFAGVRNDNVIDGNAKIRVELDPAVAAVYFVALLANGNPFLAAITEFEYPATLERVQ